MGQTLQPLELHSLTSSKCCLLTCTVCGSYFGHVYSVCLSMRKKPAQVYNVIFLAIFFLLLKVEVQPIIRSSDEMFTSNKQAHDLWATVSVHLFKA